jgi:hypothetical protein
VDVTFSLSTLSLNPSELATMRKPSFGFEQYEGRAAVPDEDLRPRTA